MESSSFSHREPVTLDFPNALRALRAELAGVLLLGHMGRNQRPFAMRSSRVEPTTCSS